MKHLEFLLIAVLIISCNHSNNQKHEAEYKNQNVLRPNWHVKKVTGTYLIFDNKRLKVSLCDLQYLGQMKDSVSGNPYFILVGRASREGDENLAIYIFTPSDTIKSVNQLLKYSYPGKENDYLTNQPIFESRLFLNKSSKEEVKSLIWDQKSRIDRDSYDNCIFIVDIYQGKIRERRIKENESIYKVEKSKLSQYSEMQGIVVSSEP
jgi:hypothetical protein